ncbi:MAG: CHRD domain-containing protein [Pseudolabrys sp.]|nr:CHRD domain-containing protein [Pseudolabrys sp.]MBV9954611.1 CHRD domain-containing protein [Pseudolabrys sp.]
MSIRITLSVIACATALAAAPALAQTVNLKASLSGAEEVPPTNTKGAGSVTATYDQSSKRLTWKGDYKDLTGPATAAHFHAAEKGKNGGVAVPIAPNASPFEGSATLTAEQEADLLAGRWYVNVHTNENKAGEIRGQLSR